MPLYADVIVNISVSDLDRSFQYRIPEELEGKIRPGVRVDIPFGARTVSGFVVGISREAAVEEAKIRPLAGLSAKSTELEDRSMALAAWMHERYGCTMNQAIMTVLPVKKVTKKGAGKVNAVPLADLEPDVPPALNAEQQAAVKGILEEMDGRNRPSLLFGVTGSGKTEVYMALIAEMIERGKQTILLIPEIALTYQYIKKHGTIDPALIGDRAVIGEWHFEPQRLVAPLMKADIDLIF